jgi:hypothetical protein
MKGFVFILLYILLPVSLFSQETEYLELVKAESELHDLFNELYTDTVTDIGPLPDTIQKKMLAALSLDGSIDFPWKRLDKIGIVTSEDKELRIFTWHVAEDADHYHYYGNIQVRQRRGRSKVYALHDNGKPQRGVMKTDQTLSDWYGKLYYQIVTNRYKRKTYYTLLGMDFNNSRSTIKSIEAMMIQRNEPKFARSLFIKGQDVVDRVVLEYDKQVAISVRFEPGTGMIAFDHLVPFHPVYQGNFEFYGPDGSIDGLEFSEGQWIFQKDIDARNPD